MNADPEWWSKHVRAPEVSVWRGLAFERLCLAHVAQIKSALGISGVSSRVFAWALRSSEGSCHGAQIDLIIDREDNVINVCEVKYSAGRFEIGEREAQDLESKIEVFRQATKTNKSVHLTMITANGLTDNPHGHCVQSQVTLDDLLG